jgi:phosphoglycerol transferase MdoB-like AlkP superfamily enzyme
MEAARKEQYYSNTIFVFIGDHGIRGDANNLLPEVFTDQGLTAEHVPLLFYAPSFIQPATYSFAASQVDVLPTVAGLAGIGYRNNGLGRDLLKLQNPMQQDASFIIDVDTRRIGVVSNGLFYSHGFNGKLSQIGSVASNEKVVLSDSLKNYYRNMTDAYYHTSRYLLLNNRKKDRSSY